MGELYDSTKHTPAPDASSGDPELIVLDSCHSSWEFQPGRMRFRRTLKGLGEPHVTTGWRTYFGLQLDESSDGFVVLLNPQGTQLLRSWRHQPGHDVCEYCAGDQTQEISLEAIRQMVG